MFAALGAATLFGLATSLGFGAEQANAGLNHIFGLPVNDVSKVVLIVAIGVTIFMLTAIIPTFARMFGV